MERNREPPAAGRSPGIGATARTTAAAVGVCALTAIVATWPLVAHLTDAIPLGTEAEATVPVFSLWTLWWTADRARDGFRGYWDAA